MPFDGFPPDFVYLDVCIAVGTGRCNKSSFSGVLNHSSYHQKFQWSSTALLDLISNDQLLIMDNVLCRAVQNGIRHCSWLPMHLQIDSLPGGISEEDFVEALIQLLFWVCVFQSNIILCMRLMPVKVCIKTFQANIIQWNLEVLSILDIK